MALRVMTTTLTVLVTLFAVAGCTESTADGRDSNVTVVIDGNTFHLEPATDDALRMRGLGGRESIADDGGMIFIFPEPQLLQFVMRDCLVDIDIIFIDAQGRITAMHHMPAEPPQGPTESDLEYESRLQQYRSGARAQIAVELAGGWLERLDIQHEDRIDLDLDHLKAMAR